MRGCVLGLAFSGKTTLIRTFSGLERSPATVFLEDGRLRALAEVVKARKITGYPLELVDFDGFGRAFREDRIGQILTELSGFDLLIHVVGAFGGGSVDELMDRLLLADLERVERLLPRVEKEVRSRHAPEHRLTALQKAREALEKGQVLRKVSFTDPERRELLGFGFVTLLPQVVIWNRGEEGPFPPRDLDLPVVETILPVEEELQGLGEEEARELREAYGIPPFREAFLEAVLQATGRIRFYTGNEKEARLWLIPEGAPAVEAARAIHTDLARGFVRADVIPVEDFIRLPEEERRKHFRRVGKDWPMVDGLYVIVYSTR